MRYFSLFAGIGGFELGVERSFKKKKRKATCVGYSEINPQALAVYQRHFPKHRNFGDIAGIRPKELPDFDLLVGGFPCQSFSIAGKRKGFVDPRGNLFFDIIRILRAKKPKHLLLENVKGLLSVDNGYAFKTVITEITHLGYCVQWHLLNSKDFGTPQNRTRIFIAGHLGEKRPAEVFSFCRSDQEDPRVPGEDLAYTIDANYGKGTNTLAKSRRSLVAMLTERRTEEAQRIRQQMRSRGKDWSPRRGKKLVLRGDHLANTLTAHQSREHLLSDGIRIRRLTPHECERLQGFPDDWTEGISDTQRYKCLGNAVTVPVVEGIISSLIASNIIA